MKRIKEKNENSPEEFDMLWRLEMERRVKQFDLYRYNALMKNLKEGMNVIELGVGCSEFPMYAMAHKKLASFIGLDYSEWAVAYMKQIDPRIKYIVGDALNTKFPTGHFDATIAGELLEHLEEPQGLVREMVRITKPQGLMIASTPCVDIKDKYHVWLFEEKDLGEMFSPHSDKVEIDKVGNYWIINCIRL